MTDLELLQQTIKNLQDEIAFYKLSESERNKRLEIMNYALAKEKMRLLGHIWRWGKALRKFYYRQTEARKYIKVLGEQ